MASAGWDATVLLWDVNSTKVTFRLKGHRSNVRAVAYSPNGSLLASAAEDGTVHLWNPQTGESVRILHTKDRKNRCVAFSPDGKILAIGGWDGTLVSVGCTNRHTYY